MGTVLIDLLGIRSGPEIGFFVSIKLYFNYFLEVIEILAAWFYLYPFQEF